MTPRQIDIDQRIWQVVMLIPPGKVSTYGDVARMAGLPGRPGAWAAPCADCPGTP